MNGLHDLYCEDKPGDAHELVDETALLGDKAVAVLLEVFDDEVFDAVCNLVARPLVGIKPAISLPSVNMGIRCDNTLPGSSNLPGRQTAKMRYLSPTGR
jgi:hypothetical protein